MFGEDDDPIEIVTKIITDGQQFQSMIGNIVDSVLEILNDIEPTAVVDDAAEDAASEEGAAELSDEEKKKYIEEVKQLLMSSTIADILENKEDEMLIAIRDATGFSEKNIDAAIKKSVKPAKWFSKLKSMGGVFGFGLGGDLPLKSYGLTIDGLKEDILQVKISSLVSVAGKLKPTSSDSDVVDQTADAMKSLGAAKQDYEKNPPQQQATTPSQGPQSPNTQTTTSPADAPKAETLPGSTITDPEAIKYIKLARAVPGISDPDTAATKLQKLLSAGYVLGLDNFIMENMSLSMLLAEKAVRYKDIVAALDGHLPDDPSEQASAIKGISDEMKIELGTEFEIVGIPDTTAGDLSALKAEIEELRKWVNTLPEELRPVVADEIKDNLTAAGADSESAEGILDPDVPLDDIVASIDSENIDSIESAIDDPEEDVDPKAIADDADEFSSSYTAGSAAALAGRSGGDEILEKLKKNTLAFVTALFSNLSWSDLAVFISAAKGDDKAKKKTIEILKSSGGMAALEAAGVNKETAEKVLNATATDTNEPSGSEKGKKLDGKFKAGKSLPLNSYQEREDGKGWQSKAGENTQSKRRQKIFKTEDGARKHAMKEAKIVVAHMRGYILENTNNFQKASFLTSREVIEEYYRIGGTNKKILNEIRSSFSKNRWSTLAGFDNE